MWRRTWENRRAGVRGRSARPVQRQPTVKAVMPRRLDPPDMPRLDVAAARLQNRRPFFSSWPGRKKSAGNRSTPPDRLSTDKPHFARSSRGCAGQTRCNARDIFHCFHARLVLNSSSGRRRRACPSLVKCRKTYYARLDPVVADRRSGQRLVDPRKA